MNPSVTVFLFFFTDEHVLSVMLFGLLLAHVSSARIRWAHAHASLHYGLFRCFSVGQVSLPLGFAGRGLNRSTALPPPSFFPEIEFSTFAAALPVFEHNVSTKRPLHERRPDWFWVSPKEFYPFC